MGTSQNGLDLTVLPSDLPEDVRESYKPRSFRSASATLALLDEHDKEVGKTVPCWCVNYARDNDNVEVAIGSVISSAPTSHEFTLNKVIAKGGFGEIWEATQASLGRVIAVKRMRQDLLEGSLTTDSTLRDVELSFRQEALTAANLDHPNILPIYDFGRDEKGRAMLAMKLVRGKSWEEIIEQDRGELGDLAFLKKNLPILIKTAQAVGFAHSRGIIHRDLKPSQVMVGEFGETLLMDWGLALVYDTKKADLEGSYYIEAGIVPTTESAPNPAGTIAYMAPEQTDKTATRIGPWTDVYLLGGTLYFLLTNTVPHNSPGNVAAFYKAMHGEIQPPKLRAPDRDIPEELEALVMEAMDPNIDTRLACAKKFIQRLEEFLSNVYKKEESLELAEEAKRLISEAQTYEELGRARMAAERALVLWPGNSHAEELSEQASLSFVEMAFGLDDLGLARASIERLRNSDEKNRLLEKVAKREATKRNAALTRRTLRAAVWTMAILIIGMSAYYVYRQDVYSREISAANVALREERDSAARARESAMASRDIALQTRAEAELLVNFLAEDLSRQLTLIGREDILNDLVEKVIAYYENRVDLGANDLASLRNRAEAQRIAAMGLTLQNKPQAALELLAQSKASISASITEGNADISIIEEYAEILLAETEAYILQRRFDEALASGENAIEYFSELITARPEVADLQSKMARAIFSYCIVLYELGQVNLAISNYQRAVAYITEAVRRDPENVFFQQTLAEISTGETYILLLAGDLDGALRTQANTVSAREELAARHPYNLRLKRQVAESLLFYGDLHYEIGNFRETDHFISEALEIIESVSRAEQNFRFQSLDEARGYLILAKVKHHLGDQNEALRLLSRSEEILTPVVLADRTNETAAVELANTYLWQGVILGLYDETVGERLIDKSIEILNARSNGEEATTHLVHIRALAYTARNLYDDARRDLARLAEREFRGRDVYEFARKAGLVRENNEGYEIVLQ